MSGTLQLFAKLLLNNQLLFACCIIYSISNIAIKENMSEFVTSFPLLDQASISIKEKGSFQTQIGAQELKNIMKGIVEGLLSGQDIVRVKDQQMNVSIQQKEGRVIGNVVIEKPIKATIEIDCTLSNDEENNKRIVLKNLEISQKAGMLARAALSAVNIEGKARQALNDPNQALLNALGEQLASKDIKTTNISLQFSDNLLNIDLTGSKN